MHIFILHYFISGMEIYTPLSLVALELKNFAIRNKAILVDDDYKCLLKLSSALYKRSVLQGLTPKAAGGYSLLVLMSLESLIPLFVFKADGRIRIEIDEEKVRKLGFDLYSTKALVEAIEKNLVA